MGMSQNRATLWLAGILFLLVAATFLWCSLQNFILNPELTSLGDGTAVDSTAILSAFLWLVGHGMHWAAVIVLPTTILGLDHADELDLSISNWDQHRDT